LASIPDSASASASAEPARVLLVDDDATFRESLRQLLVDSGIKVVGEAADGAEAVDVAVATRPNVVLMDIHMPRASGVEGTRELVERVPEASVVILTISAAEQDVVDAVLAGASGYLLKGGPVEQLVEGIRAAAAGESLISPSIAAQLLRRMRVTEATPPGDDDAFDLSERELEVLRLLAGGKDNREIADELFLSEKTVKNHVSAILKKLQLQNRTEAAVFAVRTGLA
jgi:DNA-binding NarL/FixJ family response regulator